MLLHDFERTCGACPEQWEGSALRADGRYVSVYLRHRHGEGRISIGPTLDDACTAGWASSKGRDLLAWQDEDWDGTLRPGALPHILRIAGFDLTDGVAKRIAPSPGPSEFIQAAAERTIGRKLQDRLRAVIETASARPNLPAPCGNCGRPRWECACADFPSARPVSGDGEARAALETIRTEVGGCREEVDGEKCWKPADFILWGKLLPAEAFGPRCFDHAAEHVGHRALGTDTMYALVHLGRLAKRLAASAPPVTSGEGHAVSTLAHIEHLARTHAHPETIWAAIQRAKPFDEREPQPRPPVTSEQEGAREAGRAVDIIATALYEARVLDVANAPDFDSFSDADKADWRNEAAGLLHEIGLHAVADRMEADPRDPANASHLRGNRTVADGATVEVWGRVKLGEYQHVLMLRDGLEEAFAVLDDIDRSWLVGHLAPASAPSPSSSTEG